MPLATRCPHCRTAFKVAEDQLDLQEGIVRCGICQQIFNGIEHLLDGATQQNVQHKLTKWPNLIRPAKQEAQPNQTEPYEKHPPCVESKSDVIDVAEIAQLSFIHQANNKQRITRLFSIGIVILVLLLVGQATYLFRNLIAATYPPAKKTLVTLCNYVHCQIELPAQLEALVFEAAELHTLRRENTFEFGLLMRNNSSLTQAWPYIELTLQNALRQTVLRRVFSPAEYLSTPSRIPSGFPAHQEYAVHVYFEMNQVMASDFTVAIFYP